MEMHTIKPREEAMEQIMAYISREGLAAGDRLPAERQMCKMWDLSRGTVRSALSRLEKSGVLQIRKGSGVYCCGSKFQRNLQGLSSYSKEAKYQGKNLTNRLIDFSRIESDKKLSRMFSTTLGTPLWKLVRVRNLDGVPVQLDVSYCSAERFPELDRFDFEKDSLYRVFEEEYHVIPTRGEETISVIKALDEAPLLMIQSGTPVFRIESATFDQNGAMLEYNYSVVRSDHVVLSSEMKTIVPQEEGE